jgi:hypothetical protein
LAGATVAASLGSQVCCEVADVVGDLGRQRRRRVPYPNDPGILPADVGRTSFCINVSLQAYKDSGGGAMPVGGNVRITKFGWEPQQPGQSVGGLSQLPCADANCAVGFVGDVGVHHVSAWCR